MRTRHSRSIHCLAVSLAALLAGCSTLEIRESLPWEKEAAPPRASRILAIWSDTVLNSPGKPAKRGFGGRIFFYGDGESDPIEVDGSVTVYAFDAQEFDQTNVAPEKKFVFPAKNLARHYSTCSLGHSYSFWLPWDKVGGPTRQISLIVRYEGADGTVVLSDASRKLLPGVGSNMPLERTAVSSSQETVQQIGYAVPSAKPANSDTIRLNPSMSARLRRAGETSHVQRNADQQEKHFQAIQRMIDAAQGGITPFSPTSHDGAQANLPNVVMPSRSALNAHVGDPAQAGSARLPSASAPRDVYQATSTGGPDRPQSVARYRPTRSQVPFAGTAQQIGAVGQNRPSLGSRQYDRPPIQRPGTPGVR